MDTFFNMNRRKALKRSSALNSNLTPWLFLLPAILILLFVVVAPTVMTLGLSLFRWDGLGTPEFIGLQNFNDLFHDEVFYASLFNNFKWMVYFCTIPIVFGLVNALFITKTKRMQRFYRTVFFLPYICSTVVTAMIWKWIYDPFFGLNSVLSNMGIKNLPSWLSDSHIALFSVALTDSWRYVGFVMVLFLTGLSQCDRQLEEASMIDGANRFQIFVHITIPQLRPTIVLILMLSMIWSFAAFDYVYVMTSGGPGHATELLATYMYKTTIQGQAAGYACSIAVSMLFFTVIIIGAFGILKKRGWDI